MHVHARVCVCVRARARVYAIHAADDGVVVAATTRTCCLPCCATLSLFPTFLPLGTLMFTGLAAIFLAIVDVTKMRTQLIVCDTIEQTLGGAAFVDAAASCKSGGPVPLSARC